jgi:hypothetical protein
LVELGKLDCECEHHCVEHQNKYNHISAFVSLQEEATAAAAPSPGVTSHYRRHTPPIGTR